MNTPLPAAASAARPFVPASDFPKSLDFYRALGFHVDQYDHQLALITVGASTFFLQAFEAPGFAGNYMMQLLTPDLDAWWQHITSLDLAARFGVRSPRAPEMQPWGLVVAFVVDPSGVLWHFTQQRSA